MHSLRRTSSSSSSNPPPQSNKFPAFVHETTTTRYSEDAVADGDASPHDAPGRLVREEQWQPRRKGGVARAMAVMPNGPRRSRQKSLSEALRTIHNRRASVTENAHELAEALKAPVSPKLVVCVLQLPDFFFH